MTIRLLPGAVLGLAAAAAGTAEAQTISRTPVGPRRPVAIATTPRPAAPAARPAAAPIIIVDGYNPVYWVNYGYGPAVGQPGAGGYVQATPPTPQVEVPGPPPGPAMAWVGGYYVWTGAGFSWRQGAWTPIPGGYLRWVAGRWEANALGHYWVPGRWER